MLRLRPFPLVPVLLAATCCLPACQAEESLASTRPNIVMILIDTLRRDHVSPYGAKIETPTIQRLADEGQVFTNLQSSFHQTTMSMAALFTGRIPSIESGGMAAPLRWNGRTWCGMARFAEGKEDSCVPQGLTTLAESLRDAGYWTLGVVSNALLFAPSGYDQGFDSWLEVSAGRLDRPRAQLARARSGGRVNRALARALRSRPEGPAFVYIHYLDVHDYRTKKESYSNAVVRLDSHLADAIRILENAGLGDDTVIFLTSDHGESLGEKHLGSSVISHFGNPSWQPELEIPLIVSPPVFEVSEDLDRPLQTRDIPDLILQVAGGIGALADDAETLLPDELFLSEMKFVTYRKGRYKANFHRRKLDQWALYDLEVDPGETENVRNQHRELTVQHLERAREIAERLSGRLSQDEGLTERDEARLRALGYLD